MFDISWSYAGVNYSLPGNGGPECGRFTSLHQKFQETSVAFAIICFVFINFYRKLPERTEVTCFIDHTVVNSLLLFTTLSFGIELGYKLSSKQMMFILNPCHILTITQIYLLMAPKNALNQVIFRVHFYALHGATLALLLPVVNTRINQMEVEIYFIQHILLLVVPAYFIISDIYTIDSIFDLTWVMFTCSIYYFYHWIILQPIAVMTDINLNNMLCPAISDPFYGDHYRKWAFVHQCLAMVLNGIVYKSILSFIPTYVSETAMANKKFTADKLN